jgi:hypothetical protein
MRTARCNDATETVSSGTFCSIDLSSRDRVNNIPLGVRRSHREIRNVFRQLPADPRIFGSIPVSQTGAKVMHAGHGGPRVCVPSTAWSD